MLYERMPQSGDEERGADGYAALEAGIGPKSEQVTQSHLYLA